MNAVLTTRHVHAPVAKSSALLDVDVLFFRAEMAAVPWSVHKGERDSKAEYADDEIKHCALGIVGPKR